MKTFTISVVFLIATILGCVGANSLFWLLTLKSDFLFTLGALGLLTLTFLYYAILRALYSWSRKGHQKSNN